MNERLGNVHVSPGISEPNKAIISVHARKEPMRVLVERYGFYLCDLHCSLSLNSESRATRSVAQGMHHAGQNCHGRCTSMAIFAIWFPQSGQRSIVANNACYNLD